MTRGVYPAARKDGTPYWRCVIFYRGKKVSLGSFDAEADALLAHEEATRLYEDSGIDLLGYRSVVRLLPEDKCITILNHRDNGIYIKTPIYLRTGYFSYFLSGIGELKFDNDDLFYYSSHRILIHDGHLYVNDYGMQYGILSRYGIKNYAVAGKDYTFANGDPLDFRYANIIVINKYHGVRQTTWCGLIRHEARIHINGEYLIGRFPTDALAATAYNKAADAALAAGVKKDFIQNYVVEYTEEEYHAAYAKLRLPEKYLRYLGDRG